MRLTSAILNVFSLFEKQNILTNIWSIRNLNHVNPSRIEEVRRISVPRKSILDHTRWQSSFAREFDLFWTKIRLTLQFLIDFHDLNFICFKYWSEYFVFQIMKIHQELQKLDAFESRKDRILWQTYYVISFVLKSIFLGRKYV